MHCRDDCATKNVFDRVNTGKSGTGRDVGKYFIGNG
jgi:hypothetical protein